MATELSAAVEKANKEAANVAEIEEETTELLKSIQEVLSQAVQYVRIAESTLDVLDKRDFPELNSLPKPSAGAVNVGAAMLYLLAGSHQDIELDSRGRPRDTSWRSVCRIVQSNPEKLLCECKGVKNRIDDGQVLSENVESARRLHALVTPHQLDLMKKDKRLRRPDENKRYYALSVFITNMISYYDTIAASSPQRQGLRDAREKLESAKERLQQAKALVKNLEEKHGTTAAVATSGDGSGRADADLAAKLKQTFQDVYKDETTVLSRKTLESLLRRLDPSFSQDKLDALFQVADKDGNGLIDYNEFVDFVCFLGDDSIQEFAYKTDSKEGKAQAMKSEKSEEDTGPAVGPVRLAVHSPYANIAGIYEALESEERESRPIFQRLGQGDDDLFLVFSQGAWVLTDSAAADGAFDRAEDKAMDPSGITTPWQEESLAKIVKTRPVHDSANQFLIKSLYKNIHGRYTLVPGEKREGRPVFQREGEGNAMYLLSDGARWVFTNTLTVDTVFGKTEDAADHPAGIEGGWEDGVVLALELASPTT